MTHVEEGVLQAYLDAEVSAGARVEIDTHLQSCSACTAEMERIRTASQLFAAAVREADVAAPMLAAQARLAAARKLPRSLPAPRPRRALARAAMFVIGIAAVASAAVPGSPLRAWISSALTSAGLLEEQQSAAAPEAPREAPAVPRAGGDATSFFIDPVDNRVQIILTDIAPSVTVRVEEAEDERASVEVAEARRFDRASGRFEVIGVESGTIVVRIPKGIDAVVKQDGKTIIPRRAQ
jgi:hypothetical protein